MTLVLTLDQQLDEQHTIGKFRVSVTSSRRPLNLKPHDDKIAAILAKAPEARTGRAERRLSRAGCHLVRLSQAVARTSEQQKNQRLTGAQDLSWALLNSPAFLFNR